MYEVQYNDLCLLKCATKVTNQGGCGGRLQIDENLFGELESTCQT